MESNKCDGRDKRDGYDGRTQSNEHTIIDNEKSQRPKGFRELSNVHKLAKGAKAAKASKRRRLKLN